MGRFTTSGQNLLAKNQSQPSAEDGAAKIRHKMLVLKQRKQVLKNISFFGHLFQPILAMVKG